MSCLHHTSCGIGLPGVPVMLRGATPAGRVLSLRSGMDFCVATQLLLNIYDV